MPTNESTVGGVALPVTPGLINSALVDPALLGILDYLAFWLNWSLNSKLANMQGTSAEAVPTANRFPYDANAVFVRNALPALYCWCDQSVTRPVTLLRNSRFRRLRAMYVFNELVSPMGMRARAGLLGAVDAVFVRAAHWGRHREYGYNGAALGTSIAQSVGLAQWRHVESQIGMLWKIPGTTEATPARVGGGGDGAVQRGYPAVKAEFELEERIGIDEIVVPDDLVSDLSMVIETGDTTEDTVPVREGILPYPDGDPTP